jgi:hypothetical protein
VHSVVVALDNVDPIPSGALLYRCRVAIDAGARPGPLAVRLRHALSSNPDGSDRIAATVDGTITALEMPATQSNPSTGSSGCGIDSASATAPHRLSFALPALVIARRLFRTLLRRQTR